VTDQRFFLYIPCLEHYILGETGSISVRL